MRFAAFTDTGLVRRNNEDSLLARDTALGAVPNLFMVADGMGGYEGGEYASSFAVHRITELLEQTKTGKIRFLLEDALDTVNRELKQKAEEKPALKGMGTTAVLASLEGDLLHVLNVGDSRLYLFRDTLTRITRDHSWVEEMVERGVLSRDDPFYQSKKNVLTRAVGAETVVEADYFSVKVQPGDRILLCSDGLSNMVSDGEMAEILRQEKEVLPAAEQMLAAGKAHGGKDNLSVILFEV